MRHLVTYRFQQLTVASFHCQRPGTWEAAEEKLLVAERSKLQPKTKVNTERHRISRAYSGPFLRLRVLLNLYLLVDCFGWCMFVQLCSSYVALNHSSR